MSVGVGVFAKIWNIQVNCRVSLLLLLLLEGRTIMMKMVVALLCSVSNQDLAELCGEIQF